MPAGPLRAQEPKGPMNWRDHPSDQPSGYLPAGPPDPMVFEQFNGINTSTTRPGVADDKMWWCDGYMPLGPRYLRTLYGVGLPITFNTSSAIVFFAFVNIGATPYAITIHANGSIRAANTSTYVESQIAAAATITNPSRLSVGISQYGSSYVLIVADQTDGYFIWDGTLFYKAGTLAVNGITITNDGSSYETAPTVSITSGGGTGATAVATVDASGNVATVTITNPGTGYTSAPTIGFSGGGGSGAAATSELMPTAIGGTAIETYAGRIWIANGSEILFSVAGSLIDFSSANGGGSFESTDSFLRVRFTQLLQTNGFLYLIADSSINYISGVQTSGTPPVTTFTNQNADPEIGTPWPSTVGTFGKNILFANAFGAHASYGASVKKISEELDGVYNTVPNFGGLIPSTAKAIIFGKKVWMLLLPIIDPVSGEQVNKLMMWNEQRWWTSPQDITLIYIQSQEIDSVLTAWGTDGLSLYPLFDTPTTSFTKTVQSKLWDGVRSYRETKTTNRLWGVVQYFEFDSPDIGVSIDNETDSAENELVIGPAAVQWVNDAGDDANWVNNVSAAAVWRGQGIGLVVLEPTAVGQKGAFLGLTIETDCSDMALISFMIPYSSAAYRG